MYKTFTVIYRTGGTLDYMWHKVAAQYVQRHDAEAKADELRKAGFVALIHDTVLLNNIGMPVGYDSKASL